MRKRVLLPFIAILVAPAGTGATEEPRPFTEHLDLAIRVAGAESDEARAALENLGDAALAEGWLDEVKESYVRAREIGRGPEEADARLRWSLFYFRAGQIEEAQQMLRAADLLLESRHPVLMPLLQLHVRSVALTAQEPPPGDRDLYAARLEELAKEIEAETSQLLFYTTLDSWRRMAELAWRAEDRDTALRYARLASESSPRWRRWTPEGTRRFLEHLRLHFELAWTDPGSQTADEARTFDETFALAQRLRWAPQLEAAAQEAAAADAARELAKADEDLERLARDRLAAIDELDELRATLADTERPAPTGADPERRRRQAQSLRADVEFVRRRLAVINERLGGAGSTGAYPEEPAVTGIAEVREDLEVDEALVYALQHSERDYFWVVRPESTRRHRSGMKVEAPPPRPGGQQPHPLSIDAIFGEARRLLAVGVPGILTWNRDFRTVDLPDLAALGTPRETLFPPVLARPEWRPKVPSGPALAKQIKLLMKIYDVDEEMQESFQQQVTEALQALQNGEGSEQLTEYLEGFGPRESFGVDWIDADAPREDPAPPAPVEARPGELPAILPKRVLEVPGGSDVQSVAFHPGGGMVTGDADGFLRLWDAQGREKHHVEAKAGVLDLAFSPDGRYLAAATTRVRMMNSLFDASDRQELRWTDPASGAAMPLTLLSVSSPSVGWGGGGRYLLSAEARPVGVFGMGVQENRDVAPIRRRDVEGGVSHYFIGPRYPHQLAASSDGRWIVTFNEGSSLSWWDPASGEEVKSVAAAHEGVTDLAWSGDSRRLASSGEDGLVKLWRAADRQPTAQLRHSRQAVTSVAWSDDGKALAGAGQNGTVLVWNPDRGEATHRLIVPENESDGVALLDVAFAPRSGRVAGAGSSGRIYLWRIDR